MVAAGDAAGVQAGAFGDKLGSFFGDAVDTASLDGIPGIVLVPRVELGRDEIAGLFGLSETVATAAEAAAGKVQDVDHRDGKAAVEANAEERFNVTTLRDEVGNGEALNQASQGLSDSSRGSMSSACGGGGR